jgi:allophanate hydrolase subunit 1
MGKENFNYQKTKPRQNQQRHVLAAAGAECGCARAAAGGGWAVVVEARVDPFSFILLVNCTFLLQVRKWGCFFIIWF